MIKKKIPPLVKHQHHEVEIQRVRSGIHSARYWCKDCGVHVAWLSKPHLRLARLLNMI